MTAERREHGGGLDAARALWGGGREDWIDLSTGINPEPYPLPPLPPEAWTALPDRDAEAWLIAAARDAWAVPDGAAVLPAPGASALIARIPMLAPPGRVRIGALTYNEHEAAFRAAGWTVRSEGDAEAAVVVHPNNPDGRLHDLPGASLAVIDESFCDTCPQVSHVAHAIRPGVIVLKSFGKFWGLAGLRLGFAIGRPETLAPLRGALGPWPVSGPALRIGAVALEDAAWAGRTRARLAADVQRLDALAAPHAALIGGTTLFRLYDVEGGVQALRDRLAEARIWSRGFAADPRLIRLGLPPAEGWSRLEAALA